MGEKPGRMAQHWLKEWVSGFLFFFGQFPPISLVRPKRSYVCLEEQNSLDPLLEMDLLKMIQNKLMRIDPK